MTLQPLPPKFVSQWANDGTVGKLWVKEFARNREDQVGLEERTLGEKIG
jgi:hypothetical protein